MDRRIAGIIGFIDRNLDPDVSLKRASRMANLSYSYFSALFKKETGKRFLEYLVEKRIAKAQSLLRDPGREIKEVYFLIGYRSQSHFCHDFKKITALTPGEFRKLNNRNF
jgi:two-component system response regulator YesN